MANRDDTTAISQKTGMTEQPVEGRVIITDPLGNAVQSNTLLSSLGGGGGGGGGGAGDEAFVALSTEINPRTSANYVADDCDFLLDSATLSSGAIPTTSFTKFNFCSLGANPWTLNQQGIAGGGTENTILNFPRGKLGEAISLYRLNYTQYDGSNGNHISISNKAQMSCKFTSDFSGSITVNDNANLNIGYLEIGGVATVTNPITITATSNSNIFIAGIRATQNAAIKLVVDQNSTITIFGRPPLVTFNLTEVGYIDNVFIGQ